MLVLPAMVCSLWFNAAAFWTLVDDLSWLQLQTLHVFFSGVTFGNSSLINTIHFPINNIHHKKFITTFN